jgi:hypothetical protein
MPSRDIMERIALMLTIPGLFFLWLLGYSGSSALAVASANRRLDGHHDPGFTPFVNSFLVNQTQETIDHYLLADYFDRHLRGKHLVFLGDSVTRYQYLALVYSIRRNKWVSSTDRPGIFRTKSYDSWQAFLNTTNALLLPYEWCDCHRPDKYNTLLTFENRYYIDKGRDIRITYLLFNGNVTGRSFVQGHWHSDKDPNSDRSPRGYYLQPRWSYDIVDVFPWLANITGMHRPLIIVMNNGVHKHQFNDYKFADHVAAAAINYSQHFIWKTTTASRLVVHPNPWSQEHVVLPGIAHHAHDQYLCSIAKVNCLNLTWTEKVSPELFMDDFHYIAQVNNAFNMELLKLLANLSSQRS